MTWSRLREVKELAHTDEVQNKNWPPKCWTPYSVHSVFGKELCNEHTHLWVIHGEDKNKEKMVDSGVLPPKLYCSIMFAEWVKTPLFNK